MFFALVPCVCMCFNVVNKSQAGYEQSSRWFELVSGGSYLDGHDRASLSLESRRLLVAMCPGSGRHQATSCENIMVM
jgi:hypothetical protein